MKKMFLAAFVILGTTMLTAQDRDRDRIQDPDHDRLMLVDGDVLQIRDRDQIHLQDPLTLGDGTVINPDGTYLTKDRDRLRLKDGECLDNDGTKYGSEYQYRAKLNQEYAGLTNAQIQERNQNRYHVMRIDGEVYQIRNQSQSRLQQQLELADGATVNPDGSYQTQDRKQLRLQDGECLNMDGQKFKNNYQQRKMMLQKNMMGTKKMMNKKGVKKPNVQKKTGKKTTK